MSRAERAAGALPTGREVTVGFADLAGFTPLGEELTVEELGHLVRHFEDVVGKTTPTGAHHVKTIGDAAMIVADDPEAVLHVLVELVRTASEHEVGLPPIHAGMAVGRAVTREGDWHGSPVNIASRLADAAPAGRVFATEAARRAAGDGAAWTDAGTRRLKGVDEAIRVFCLAPAASDQR